MKVTRFLIVCALIFLPGILIAAEHPTVRFDGNWHTKMTCPPRGKTEGYTWQFNSVIQNALICFNDTPPAGVILPFVAGAANNDCAGNDTSNNLLANSYYTNHTNFGMTTIRFKPEKRVTANLGYSITSVEGSVPQFNILQPLGTLQYKYSQPVANLSVDLGHRLAWNLGWNYYQYNEGSIVEGSFVGPTAPRYFHANSVTESLRYAF